MAEHALQVDFLKNGFPVRVERAAFIILREGRRAPSALYKGSMLFSEQKNQESFMSCAGGEIRDRASIVEPAEE
jgi:hypothetical protein